MPNKKPNLNCETCPGRSQSIFCELEGDELNTLNQDKNTNIYKKGQNLFLEGSSPFGFFCVHSGKIKLTKTDIDGKETIVRLATSGDVLGHQSLFSNSPYAASATMLDDGVICFVSRETIHDMIRRDPRLSFQIIQRISAQMGAAEEKLASMAYKSVRERFAEMLLLLEQGFGSEQSDGRTLIDVPLTRDEMASMIGAASENVTRLITEYKNDGFIEQEGKAIYILDASSIEREANLSI